MDSRRPDCVSGERLRPFCAANLHAYIAVLAAWVTVSAVVAGIASTAIAGRPSFMGFFVTALVAVMGGMAIMFVSSLINLRKLHPGFERLACGEADPEIPPVWCPVLTSAAQAARQLAHHVAATQGRNGQ
ncbi:MAG: hypothetical protein HXY19_07175 [Thermoanaerobaculaceae bacterium]|nr:hypothetical protein [Thermoanaerobaculaceae bacterium]